MPKDVTKNIDRYKIRGGQLNEFDFQQNQADLAEELERRSTNLIPGTPPEEMPGLRPPVSKPATKKAATKAKIATKATKAAKNTKGTKTSKAAKASKARSTSFRGATAKKLAARKAAKK